MSRFTEFQQRGQADLLAGKVGMDSPPVDGGPRWGMSAILRPTGDILDRILAVSDELAGIMGPGHWVHGPGALHTTLRCFERHSTRPLVADQRLERYIDAIETATAGMAPVELELRGLAPHSTGVMLFGHGGPAGMPLLRQRLVDALEAAGVADLETDFVRDIWYLNLVHYAAPLGERVDPLLDWGRTHRDRPVGTLRYGSVDIVRWRMVDGAIRPEVLHAAKLDG